ncbi:hypothetical protein Zm00014a_027244 [Zea mays]|uniref:Ribosomal protein S21 family protein n=1 Tax=Zea mays TaxID=4577 RepID=A0A317YCL0_MAIZE|nr:hypothetical protein Zm00014a_027244 [Zea mays]
MEAGHRGQVQQARGIVVQVRDGNLERALAVMERKMRSSGMERLIRARTHYHVKDSEKRVLARKALMQRVRSQELGKKLREILIKKIRSGPPSHLHCYMYLLTHCFYIQWVEVTNWSEFYCDRQVLDEMSREVLFATPSGIEWVCGLSCAEENFDF